MPHVIEHYDPPAIPWLTEIYADAHVVLLNKPSGLLSVPGKSPDHQDSLTTRAQESYGRVFAVHRLDMETSGLMLLARSKAGLAFLSRQFEERRVKKVYAARLFGLVHADAGVIDLPLICDWPNRPRQIVDHSVGKQAITRYVVIERVAGDADTPPSTRVAFHPETGRSHQLRVHAAEIGHPILGDPLYAHAEAKAAAPRLQLHAERLELILPDQTEPTAFYCPAPF